MKRLSYIVIIVMAILNLQACYDDKGHYDYTPSTIPTITGIPETCDAYFGSPLSIPVTITYPEAAWENVDYEWRVNLEVISTDKDLNLKSVDLDVKAGQYADYKVINRDTGEYAMVTFKINVSTEFATGWFLLSEEPDCSVLSYIRGDGVVYSDVYEELNGEKLGKGAVQIKEHWIPWGAETGEVFVGVPSGPNYAVDLDGNSLKRMVYSKDEFLEGQPDDFAPTTLDCVMNWDYMISNGKLYARYVESGLDAQYHEGRFVRVPMPGDYELSPLTLRGNLVFSSDVIAFDLKHKSWKLIRSGELRDFDYKNDPNQKFQPTDMGKTLLAGGPTAVATPTDDFIAFLRGDDGQIYVQKFRYSGWSNKTYASLDEKVFPAPELIRDDTQWAVCMGRTYAYFTSGNRLYAYNYGESANTVKELKGTTFTRPIRAIALNPTSKGEELAVAVENEDDPEKSDFMLLDVGVVADGMVIEGSLREGAFGKVYYMTYKVGDQWSISN